MYKIQVNLCQKFWFLHQLTHNMTTDCSLNYKFNTWKFQAQTWGEHIVYSNCFRHSEQFLYTTCSPHVLQEEELLTKIYLYIKVYSKKAPIIWQISQLLWNLIRDHPYITSAKDRVGGSRKVQVLLMFSTVFILM